METRMCKFWTSTFESVCYDEIAFDDLTDFSIFKIVLLNLCHRVLGGRKGGMPV